MQVLVLVSHIKAADCSHKHVEAVGVHKAYETKVAWVHCEDIAASKVEK